MFEAVLEAQRRSVERVLDIHQRFTRIVLEGGGPAESAAALHDVLGCTITVVDTEGRPLVVVPSDDTRSTAVDGRPGVRHPIRAGDQVYGEIVANSTPAALGTAGAVALERAAMAVAMRQAQANAVSEAQERFAAISLEELVSGHMANVSDVAERAISFGWDLSRPRAVLLASIDPPETGTIAPGALATIAAAARATLGRDAIVWTRTATIAALIAPETDRASERRGIAERLQRELDLRLRTTTVSIGVGRRVVNPIELSQSFSEANRAVAVGRWVKGRHVTEVYDQLGLERLLAATPSAELVEFVGRAIGPLVEHDRTHETELVETLAIWLETRNMAEAGRRIHVHYNTLKNRLQRIEAIIGPVLTDASLALECEVALHVLRHHEMPSDRFR